MRSLKNAVALPALLSLSGCATLGQFTALQDVDFSIDGLSEVLVAGIDVTGVRSMSDLSFSEGATLAAAVQRGDLPLHLELEILARNPEENLADARLIRMDWTLLLEGRETVSGVFADEIVLPRGKPTTFPVVAELNLIEFFEGNAADLVDLAASLAGVGGEAKDIELRARPVVQTALGPISYPTPIRIVGGRVGD
jgi:hypothetical protein